MPEQKQTSFRDDVAASFNIFTFVIRIHTSILDALFKKAGTCGVNHFGLPALLALPVIVFLGSSREAVIEQPGTAGIGTLLLLLFFLVRLIQHRVMSSWRESRGVSVHSRCIGESIFYRDRFGFRSLKWAEDFWEPVAAAALGVGLMLLNYVLGALLIWGCFSLWVRKGIMQMHERVILRAYQDQVHEAQYYGQMMRQKDDY